jgi:hypothetical protein
VELLEHLPCLKEVIRVLILSLHQLFQLEGATEQEANQQEVGQLMAVLEALVAALVIQERAVQLPQHVFQAKAILVETVFHLMWVEVEVGELVERALLARLQPALLVRAVLVCPIT